MTAFRAARRTDGADGRARLRQPVRDEVTLQVCDLDALIGEDHAARIIWAYAAKVDLSDFESAVKAREGPGHAADLAASSAGALALCDNARHRQRSGAGAPCESDAAFRWLCGGVSVNHRLLSEFRTQQGDRIGRLLADHVASLSAAGLINFDEIAQDGVRVRACAGAASFRRRKTLEKELAKAKALIARLSQDEDDDPGASGKRGRRRASGRRGRERRGSQRPWRRYGKPKSCARSG